MLVLVAESSVIGDPNVCLPTADLPGYAVGRGYLGSHADMLVQLVPETDLLSPAGSLLVPRNRPQKRLYFHVIKYPIDIGKGKRLDGYLLILKSEVLNCEPCESTSSVVAVPDQYM